MSNIVGTAVTSDLDYLLDEVCRALQISDTQYQNARQKYEAVGKWLSDKESPLSVFNPYIYPQGSMLLQTTVRPWEAEEYDLDLVCLLNGSFDQSMVIYNMVTRRLQDNEIYRQRLSLKKRCLRLEYAGRFHLDILPAQPDIQRGGTAILVPDRELHAWKESNPKGFATWFEYRAKQAKLVHAEREIQPLPEDGSVEAKSSLSRAVQLIKRHRDVVFEGSELTPLSVILTTLAGQHYKGDDSNIGALGEIMKGIMTQIDHTSGILQVVNPTNEAELFTESWEQVSYGAFVDFISDFWDRVQHLRGLTGIDEISKELQELFGEHVGQMALEAYTKRFSEGRKTGHLRFTRSNVGLSTAVTGTYPIRRNTFHGR